MVVMKEKMALLVYATIHYITIQIAVLMIFLLGFNGIVRVNIPLVVIGVMIEPMVKTLAFTLDSTIQMEQAIILFLLPVIKENGHILN